jgi:hypothetical protein
MQFGKLLCFTNTVVKRRDDGHISDRNVYDKAFFYQCAFVGLLHSLSVNCLSLFIKFMWAWEVHHNSNICPLL